MRLIDADALIDAMTKFSNAIGEDMTHGIFYAHIAPTIDAVPVIRCKDCRNKEDCQWYYYSEDDYGYCKWAERKPPQVNPEMVKALKDRIEKQRGEDAKRKS